MDVSQELKVLLKEHLRYCIIKKEWGRGREGPI